MAYPGERCENQRGDGQTDGSNDERWDTFRLRKADKGRGGGNRRYGDEQIDGKKEAGSEVRHMLILTAAFKMRSNDLSRYLNVRLKSRPNIFLDMLPVGDYNFIADSLLKKSTNIQGDQHGF